MLSPGALTWGIYLKVKLWYYLTMNVFQVIMKMNFFPKTGIYKIFVPQRLVFEFGPKEGGPVERPQDKGKENREKDNKLRQEFKLGQHDVLDRDKLDKNYVSQISGSVDITSYSPEKKTDQFIQNDVLRPCERLYGLYLKNKGIFTQSALNYIEENLAAVKKIIDMKPGNNQAFEVAMKNCPQPYDAYGPDGVLNLLLAFNRVTEILKPGELDAMADSQAQQMLKIDLRKRATRSVEVSIFTPEITKPDISKIRGYDDSQKFLRPDGTMEVQYWNKAQWMSGPGSPPDVHGPEKELMVSLLIDPKKQMVTINKINERYPGSITVSIGEFDKQLIANPNYLKGNITNWSYSAVKS
jgi:hypothetical protein